MSEKKFPFDFEAVFQPDDYLYFYGLTITDEVSDKQTAFLERELKLVQSMRVLDLACGYGRHANRLARKGCTVVGVDTSEAFLELARKEAETERLTVTYLKQDMRRIDFNGEFDRIIMMFTAVGYFDDDENMTVFRNITRALKPGGLFCFDTFNRDLFLKNIRTCHVTDNNDDTMIDRVSFDSVTGRLHNRRTIIRHGKKRDFEFSIRLYNPTEIKLILKEAGLNVVNFYSDWESNPLNNNPRMITVARK
ncbi:MAG: SAM-dependent methyltransferase [Candidatus Zixiibacteriota bacterium]